MGADMDVVLDARRSAVCADPCTSRRDSVVALRFTHHAETTLPVPVNLISSPLFLEVLPEHAVVAGKGNRYRKTENGSFECLTDRTCPLLRAAEMPRTVRVVFVPSGTYECGCTDHACTGWGCGGCHKAARRNARRAARAAA